MSESTPCLGPLAQWQQQDEALLYWPDGHHDPARACPVTAVAFAEAALVVQALGISVEAAGRFLWAFGAALRAARILIMDTNHYPTLVETNERVGEVE